MSYDVILRQHVEDAALHWVAFEETCNTQPTDHPDIRYYGKRLEPHLKGLALAVENAWPFAIDAVRENPGDADPIFVAMWLALADGSLKRIKQVAHVAKSAPEAAIGALGAVHWVSIGQLAPFVRDWIHQEDPVLRAMALRSCLLHGSVPSHLKSDLHHTSALVRCEAIKLCALRAPHLFEDDMSGCLADPEVSNRLAAALTAAKAGHRQVAIQTLVEIAQTQSETADMARDWASVAMTTDELAKWTRHVRKDVVLVTRLVGLAGVSTYWPWLIEKMADPATSVASGLAARDLSGQDLFASDLFYSDADDLPEALNMLDPDAADIPNANQFRKALEKGLLVVPPDMEMLSARAQKLNGMRLRASQWPDTRVRTS